MNPTIMLGRIAGVRVGLNWSWLLAFALIGCRAQLRNASDPPDGFAHPTGSTAGAAFGPYSLPR